MAELDKNAMKYPYGELKFTVDVYETPIAKATIFCYDIEEILDDDKAHLFVDSDLKIRFDNIIGANKLTEIRYAIYRLIDDYDADLIDWSFVEQFRK